MMAATTVLGAVASAQAASYDGSCDYDEACLYRYQDYSGGIYDTLNSKTSYAGTYYGTSVAVDNTVSSAKNKDPNSNLWLYQYDNWAGDTWGLPAGSSTNFSSSFDNLASSHCWTGATAGCPGG
jgi:hypothetical protein